MLNNMELFIGTKTVEAKPMTRGEYNTLRGWQMPKDENPNDEGYLVKYLDSQPNHPDFDGYISWSPKSVFEQTYKPTGTTVVRMQQMQSWRTPRANWCIGGLKIRGEKKNILKFLNQCIPSYIFKIKSDEVIQIPKPSTEYFGDAGHIKGTYRCFHTGKIERLSDEPCIVFLSELRCALGFNTVIFQQLSKQYNLDFKFYSFNKDQQFNSDVEIHRGEIIKAETITFENYAWECIYPNLGG